MGDYRSVGSNFHPSCQSRKISIGVMADSLPKRNPGPDKGDGDQLKSLTVVTDSQLNRKVVAPNQRSSAKGTEYVTSPSWRTRENALCKQASSFSGIKGLSKGLDGAHQAPARDSFQNFPISSPQRGDDELNGGRNGKEIDTSPEMMGELQSVVLQQKVASQREEMDKPDKDRMGSTAVLRSKLWETLGKSSRANNEDVNSETPEVVKTKFKLSQDKGSNNDPLTKPRHNSDFIETSPESHENAARRPVTRSLLQRSVGEKGVQKRAKSGGKSAEQVYKIFSFEEGLSGKTGTASFMPKKQRGGRKSTVVTCRKVQSREKSDAKRKRTGKRSSLSDKKGSSLHLQQQTKARKQKPDIITREKDFHSLREAETAATREMFHGLSKNGDEQERLSKVLRERSVEPENELQSPTFGYKAPISTPYPCWSPEASPFHPRNINLAFDETETPILSFGANKTFQRTKGQASDTEKRLPDFLDKKGDYSFRRESSGEPTEDLVLSDPSSDEEGSDKSREDSPALGHCNSPEERETVHWNSEKSKPGFSSAKRNSNPKDNGRVVLGPTSSLSKGIRKINSFQQFSEMEEDEGLGRAVALFAVALQNFEKKLKYAAKKKSSEIIASVSEEIHLELENVKSHIITEAVKTSNVAKTKRKHAETRLQEEQEKMRMIHEKLKDDVGQHLEDLQSTIKGLEANHSELKGTIKKQRTSHQKLMAHFEGGIETKLDNATKRINYVNESARRNMLQLKMVVAECLKDGVLD
ncbi:unnamed protein product [Eruca vesicaria subsp. sativa]|uniref:Meiosis-specific protein ASY3-like coiled-coil domain-containing protein n=1 Tax=Eruca vesicaria subsp. sativa TaxID=29727 RepID=A0ABC8L0Q8_ERUVS|nr:unnamed protein product [Eruca vesicaria subsp. sativa]